MSCRRLSDYIHFFKIFSCQVRVKSIKIGIKNATPNTILMKNKCNKVLKNGKSLKFSFYKSDLDMICSFVNKDNKIAKSPKCDVSLFFSAYINV